MTGKIIKKDLIVLNDVEFNLIIAPDKNIQFICIKAGEFLITKKKTVKCN